MNLNCTWCYVRSVDPLFYIPRISKKKLISLFRGPHQAPLSMGFSRQEYWSGLPFPSPDLPDPGTKPRTPVLQENSLENRMLLLFSPSVLSYSLLPRGLQHARLPCPSLLPEVWSNSCPSSRWCHPKISSSGIPFSSCLLSFPALGSFQMSQFFASGGQILEFHRQHQSFQWILDWFPWGLTGWISLQSKELSRVFSNTIVPNHQSFSAQLSLWSNAHTHTWLLEKPEPWLDRPLLAK